MSKIGKILLLIVLGSCTRTSPQATNQRRKTEPDDGKTKDLTGKLTGKKEARPSVDIQLIHSGGSIAAGSTIELAAKLEIEPGWHIYWESPGDSGLATSLQIEAPTGFRIEKPLFPAPQRFTAAGPAYTFVYFDETVLFTNLELPQKFVSKFVQFRAELEWLACKRICIRGKSRASLEIPSSNSPASDPIVERFRSKLPQPLLPSTAEIVIASTSRGRKIDIKVRTGSIIDFFPLAIERAFLDKLQAGDRWLSISYIVPARLSRTFGGRLGVLAIRDSRPQVGYYEVRVHSSVPPTPIQPRE